MHEDRRTIETNQPHKNEDKRSKLHNTNLCKNAAPNRSSNVRNNDKQHGDLHTSNTSLNNNPNIEAPGPQQKIPVRITNRGHVTSNRTEQSRKRRVRSYAHNNQRSFFVQYMCGNRKIPACPGKYRETKSYSTGFITRYIPVQNSGNRANKYNLIQIPIQTNINSNSRPFSTRSQNNVVSHKLKIAHLNIRSLRNTSHLIETKELVKSHKIDVLTMSETWLNSTVTNGEIAIDDYKIYRLDRLHKKGGGVCVFAKKVLKVTILNELTSTSESNFQQLWIKLQNKKMKTIIICVTYRPPDCPLNCIQDDFRQNYVQALSMNKPIFILGDLNCNLLKDCPEKRAITELCNDLNLKQIIKEPTRITDTSQSLIDVILVSTEAVVLESGVLDSAISDHFPIYVSTKLKVLKTPPTYITVRSFKNYYPNAFSSDLATKSDRLLSIFTETDVNTKTEVLKDVIQSTLDSHAPIKTIKIRSRSNTFVTPDTKELMKSRDKLHQRFLKTRCKRDWEMYR